MGEVPSTYASDIAPKYSAAELKKGGLDNATRERKDEAYFRKLSDPKEQRLFRQGPTEKKLGMVMRSLARTNAEWVRAFKEKPGLERRGALPMQDEKGRFVGNGTILKVPFTADTYHHVVVTASHVADLVPAPLGTQWTHHPQGRDVAMRKLSEEEFENLRKDPSNVLVLGPDRDVSGETGAVDAYDNDDGSLGRKLFPSRISPPTSPRVLGVVNVSSSEKSARYYGEDYAALRMMVLPAGQAWPDARNKRLAEGMSGAAFVYFVTGQGESKEAVFGGMFVAVIVTEAEGVSYDTGLVIDQKCVRETLEEYLRTTRSIRMSSN